jgi:hypothetical protein
MSKDARRDKHHTYKQKRRRHRKPVHQTSMRNRRIKKITW